MFMGLMQDPTAAAAQQQPPGPASPAAGLAAAAATNLEHFQQLMGRADQRLSAILAAKERVDESQMDPTTRAHWRILLEQLQAIQAADDKAAELAVQRDVLLKVRMSWMR
jgi:hypothetical protein